MTMKDLKDLERRAEEGEVLARTEFGKMYYEGEGVPRHYETAANLFLKAANHESADAAEAQFYLGKMLDEGKVEIVQRRDPEESKCWAEHWISKSADVHGLADAQLYLGKMRDKQKNYIEAYKWFSLAAAQGNEDAGEKLDELEKNMSREDIINAQKSAASWWRGRQKSAAK